MRRGVTVAVIGALALAACHKSEDKAPAPAASPTPAAIASGAPAVAKATCAPAPTLALSQDFADPRDEFGVDSKPFKQLEANFAAAYGKACDSGVLAREPLIPKDVPHPGMLFLTGAPESNEVSIYRETDQSDQPGDMTLEYYFIAQDGSLHVPSVADLNEAIYCAVQGASEQEEDASGRCLVD
jgi:hypothetical protein